ncbi:MAG: flagellar filament capping protein FliD, partial [Defluviitaleaceae bacterium]|nr:flagellar filament capping protein FliD [Defluviitaleaceae bacterium]
FDFETTSFSFHSDTAGAPIPTFEILPVDPADPTNAATAANRATTSTILTELLVGIPVPVAVSNRVAAANAARATSPIHNPSLSQEITDSQSVTITVGTGSDTETTTLNFDPGTSFREIMDAINAIDGVNVTFNSATGQFTFSTTGDEPVGVSGIGFLGFAPTGSISIRQGAAPPTGAVTSNTVNPGTLTPSSYVRDFIDINQYPSITIGGRTITININDTFLDLIGAINSLLAGNPAPGTPLYGNPNYTGDLGFRADLSGNGAFFLVATGTGTASSIEIGEDGESNALLRLMFGADYRTINSPPETFVHNPTLDTQVGAVRIATITVGEGSDAVTTPLTFFNNMTYQQIMDEINNIAGVQMTFDPISGTFTISPTDGQVFRAEGLGFLGFPSTVEGNFEETPSRLVRTAQNAIIYYDVGAGGLPPVRLEQATNNFDLHGMRITLSSAVETATRSDDGTYVGGIFTINSERDIEDTYAAVREFVENYNNLIRMLNDLHSTPRPRAGNHHRGALFEPLTDEERAGMSDRDIERWEEQARTGLLHRDRDIRNIQQQLRDAMFQPVRMNDGTTFSLHQIGIQTIGINGAANDRLIGVLEIDSDRLRAALEQDPDRVRQLFARNHVEANTHDGPTLDDDVNIRVAGTSFEQRNINFRHVGLGFRIHELLDTVANNVDSPLQQRAGYHFGVNTSENTISRQIADYNRRIDAMQQFLIRRENHFFSMFARMEQAMAQSHAQMDSLFAFMTQ